jgi:hypothetical protein
MVVVLVVGCSSNGDSNDAGPDFGDSGAPEMDAGSPAFDGGLPLDARLVPDAGGPDGAMAVCPPPGAMLPDVPYLDRPAGAFSDPSACAGCPGEIGFSSLMQSASGTTATVSISFAPDEVSVECMLAVVSECGRAVFEIPWSEFGMRPARTVPLFCGDNRLIVVCENAEGRSVRVSRTLSAPPCVGGSIRATLTWDECGTDHELHIVRNGFTLYDVDNDCTWNDCTDDPMGLDWPPAGPEGNATKDIDDTGTSGIENGRVTGAAPGIYHILVELWGSARMGRGCGGTSESSVDVFVDDVLTASLVQSLALYEVWYVGIVEMPAGTFTPATALGMRTTTATVTDCARSWGPVPGGLTGCMLPLPDAL